MELDPTLQEALRSVATAMAPASHEWWILAGCAVALHGGEGGTAGDIDVLFDLRDAEAILSPLGLCAEPGEPDGRFRSECFARWHGAALGIEFFAGFQLFEGAGWCTIRPQTRQKIEVAGCTVYVPQRAELKAMLQRFGRAKDLRRAATL